MSAVDVSDSARTSATDYKAQGNASFKARNYEDAVAQYAAAIAVASAEEKALLATCHLNRAMAELKLAEAAGSGATGDVSPRKRELLEAALKDAKEGAVHDPTNPKAPFREAAALLQLGGRETEANDALHRAFRLSPGDKEVRSLLVQHDSVFARFESELERLSTGVDAKRTSLHQMVHRSHPMNMRVLYYRTWMVVWQPDDRECALSSAFMEVLKGFDAMLKNEAHDHAVGDKQAGKVDFEEDGFGVWRHKNKTEGTLRDEGYTLTSIVLEDLITEECYNQPDLYCATVEAISEGREDEPRWLPADRLERMHALRPTILMGEMCHSHPLKEWMIARMSENLRKQILIGVCLHVCMAAAGLVSTQIAAMHELRNLRRKHRGLLALKPGEESEDDEIMEKTDYDEYRERTLISGPKAQALLKMGSQALEAHELKSGRDLEKEMARLNGPSLEALTEAKDAVAALELAKKAAALAQKEGEEVAADDGGGADKKAEQPEPDGKGTVL